MSIKFGAGAVARGERQPALPYPMRLMTKGAVIDKDRWPMLGGCRLRPFAASDSLEALTALLHRAYAPLGAMGLNFTAVDQDVEATRACVASGPCFVAEAGGEIVGTVTVCGAYDPNTQPWARATPWFYRHDVAHLHQLAVDPAAQALALREPLATAADVEHRCAQVRTLWAHMQARDWPVARALYADTATMVWPCSGERFLDADAIVRVNAVYPEGWGLRVVAVDALADGRVHSVVEVSQPPQRFFANSRFRFSGAQVVEIEEYWASAEPPPAWRTAAAIGAYERIDTPP